LTVSSTQQSSKLQNRNKQSTYFHSCINNCYTFGTVDFQVLKLSMCFLQNFNRLKQIFLQSDCSVLPASYWN